MKSLSIISMGMGEDTMTAAAIRAVEDAQVLLGAPRMLAQFKRLNKPSFPVYAPALVTQILDNESYQRFALLVSGDAGLYSAADAIIRALPDDVASIEVFPGVSSLQYLFARMQRPWEDIGLVSCHGRDGNLVDAVRRNETTFALTGGNVAGLARQLIDGGYGDLTATLGENLGLTNERILTVPVSALPNLEIGALAVLAIDNPDFNARVRFGIADSEFVRGDVPMTKAEVRAVALSKLALSPDTVCYDVGAGTGSVTVETALASYRGHVYAIDRSEEAIRLVQQNCSAFHIGNVTPVLGSAPDVLADLPKPDAVFIGGSGGNLGAIFDCVLNTNPRARMVVNAIALQSVNSALAAFTAHGIEPEMVQLSVSRGKAAGGMHLLTAMNPVFIISGGGYER